MKLQIKGFIQNSLLDWDGKIVSTLYTPYCNFRCPYCHNGGLVLEPEKLESITFEEIKDYLEKNKKWVDGICLTGGEPCIFKDLPEFIQKIRDIGVMVKFDTNGTFPEMLQRIIDKKLVEYIAMDIKAPLDSEAYARSIGVGNKYMLDRIKKTIKIIMNSGLDYEFRTTVVPTLHTEEDIEKIAKSIKGAKKYALQNFSNKGEILDPKFAEIKPYYIETLQKMCDLASSYVDKCVVRGG
ncbi:anaerobic ribonucleoside-triphosphate reductase activating protein [bacterium]|nr:anaerobic ribonucleoside-triphosphate reductase activating protein [bacterium]